MRACRRRQGTGKERSGGSPDQQATALMGSRACKMGKRLMAFAAALARSPRTWLHPEQPNNNPPKYSRNLNVQTNTGHLTTFSNPMVMD